MKIFLCQFFESSLCSLVSILGLIMLSVTTVHADEYVITGVPAGDVLNVRSGASSLHEIVATLKQGDAGVTITGGVVMNGDTDWVPISFAGKKGWVRPKFLRRVKSGDSSGSLANEGGGTQSHKEGQSFVVSVDLEDHTLTLPAEVDWKNSTSDVTWRFRTSMVFVASSVSPPGREICLVDHFAAEDPKKTLSTKELEKTYMDSLVQNGEKNGTLKRAKVILFGKAAHAVLADDREDVTEGVPRMVLSAVFLEPARGYYYSLTLKIAGASIMAKKTPQELVSYLMKGK